MRKDHISDFRYRSALKKARRPPFNWFAVFGIVLSVLLVTWITLKIGWIAFFAASVTFIIIDRINRKKVEERVAELKIQFGRLDE